MSSIFSQELAVSASDSKELGCEPSRSVRSTQKHGKSSQNIGQAFPSSMMSEPSTMQEAMPVLYAVVSHAKTLATLTQSGVNAPDLPASVQGSGESFYEPFAWFDQTSQSWRTWQRCLVEGWQRFSETWPASAMMRNGVAYAPATSVHRTTATAFTLLPTPSAREGRDWSQAQILARLDRGGCVARRICSLSSTLRSSAAIVGLNPSFAEWMMGYPEGWTACMASAMRSSRKSQKSSDVR